MVEVFKTDVSDEDQANDVVAEIHMRFPGYLANFDLEDCDKILRIRALSGPVSTTDVIALLKQAGIQAMVLPDIVPLSPSAQN